MPRYEIEQYEVHVMPYEVEADTEAEAIARLLGGSAEQPGDGSHEFTEVCADRRLPSVENGEFAAGLRSLGVPTSDVIPSVRSIRQVR